MSVLWCHWGSHQGPVCGCIVLHAAVMCCQNETVAKNGRLKRNKGNCVLTRWIYSVLLSSSHKDNGAMLQIFYSRYTDVAQTFLQGHNNDEMFNWKVSPRILMPEWTSKKSEQQSGASLCRFCMTLHHLHQLHCTLCLLHWRAVSLETNSMS